LHDRFGDSNLEKETDCIHININYLF